MDALNNHAVIAMGHSGGLSGQLVRFPRATPGALSRNSLIGRRSLAAWVWPIKSRWPLRVVNANEEKPNLGKRGNSAEIN
jgi:hypothetical protein